MLDMTKVDLVGKRVLIREDLNVPLRDGHIVSDERIQRALPTLQYALKNKARVMVLSHLGRPQEGQPTVEYSLAPVADALSQALNQTVPLVSSYLDGLNVEPGAIVLCENVRFNRGEQANDVELSKRLAALCDVFVMDAFATAHRAQASTEGVIKYAPIACAGPLLKEELTALSAALNQPAHPLLAIVGGSKVSTKIQLLEQLLTRVDTLIVGGGIANTFLAAAGYSIGKSLYEKDWVDAAKQLLKKAQKQSVHIPLPVDLRVAETFSEKAPATVKLCDAVQANELILDVGPKTEAQYPAMMQAAKTIVWNGPVGVFEFDAFSAGTRALGNAIVSSPAYSIAGGGDTIAALEKNQLSDRISYVCTGGGAFLEYLEGKTLPAVAALEERAHYAETS